MARLEHVPAPSIALPDERPELPIAERADRIAAARRAAAARDLELLVVYADREHAATLEFLTGVDPRFEEAILLLPSDASRPARLLLGNECVGYGPDPALGIEVERWQDLSLPGQTRASSRPLRVILAEAGVERGSRVGTAGWKTLDPRTTGDQTAIELPAYLVDALRDLAGGADPATGTGGDPGVGRRAVVNANAIFTDRRDGLRIRVSGAQIARWEYAAMLTSVGVRRAQEALVPGARERDAERELENRGLTLSCHTMVNVGAKVARGLSSPGDARAARGDAFQIAYGLAGGLTCRAGAIAAGPDDLAPEHRAYAPALFANYFDVVATWHERVRIGATGGEVFAAVDAVRDPALYEFMLNPGHYLGWDEWVESPFAPDEATELASGMVMQCDIIPVVRVPGTFVNIEDGVALADAALRAEIARDFPAMSERIEARRTFLRERLGVVVDSSLLPLSNTPLWHSPFSLAPDLALVRG